MNNQLIEKVIKSNNEHCPELIYRNPLLDINVARALAKSFMKILDVSKQNSNMNNNLRRSVLSNIRKICQMEPENHIKVNENFTQSIVGCYLEEIKKGSIHSSTSIDKTLDNILLKKIKESDISSKFETPVHAEIVQALLNLNDDDTHINLLSENIFNWKMSEEHLVVLKDLWSKCNLSKESLLDDISIRIKSEIEILLLNSYLTILKNENVDITNIFSTNNYLEDLIKKCIASHHCFQICCSILNSLFIKTNFNLQLQEFISIFIKNVKLHCIDNKFSLLYPAHLNTIVLLLDFDMNILPEDLKKQYIAAATHSLEDLHRSSENDLILLLSHFPQWFDVYFMKFDS